MAAKVAKEIVVPGAGREPLGPYSVGVKAQGFVFTAGQIGWDVRTRSLVEGGIGPQTRQTLENLRGVLEDAGTSLEAVVKVTVFLADMTDWPAVNEVYAEVFAVDPPARSAVAVSALPAGALIEMEAVALVG